MPQLIGFHGVAIRGVDARGTSQPASQTNARQAQMVLRNGSGNRMNPTGWMIRHNNPSRSHRFVMIMFQLLNSALCSSSHSPLAQNRYDKLTASRWIDRLSIRPAMWSSVIQA